jgi:hypothetical protein
MSPWLLIPLGLLGAWIWVTGRTMARTGRQLQEAESRLARRLYKLQGQITEIDATVKELDFERRRRRGEIRFTADTTVAESVAVHPRVGEILAGFGLAGSGCSGGGGPAPGSTLAAACAERSLDVRSVLEALDRFVTDPDAPVAVEAATAKLYRIRRPGEAANGS